MSNKLNQISEDIQNNLIALLEEDIDPKLLCAVCDVVVKTVNAHNLDSDELPTLPKFIHIDI